MSNPLLDRYPHPGKYEGELNLTERLDSEGGDVECGSVETFGHYQLFLRLDSDESLGDLDGIVAGILHTDSQGFVYGEYYTTEAEAKRKWARIEKTEEQWYEDEEEAEEDYSPSYYLRFVTFSGMSIPIAEKTDREDGRLRAAQYLRRLRRHGQTVTVLTKGKNWEAIDPETAGMVSDDCGVLYLTEVK